MLGTKTIGRSLVFGLGYLAGTRAGRERYDQISQGARSLAGQLRTAARRGARPVALVRGRAPLAAPGTTATSRSGSPEPPCSSASTSWRGSSGCRCCGWTATSCCSTTTGSATPRTYGVRPDRAS